MLALENRVENLLTIYKAVNSPWLGINIDTGNYPGDPYVGIGQLAGLATIVQAKTYYGGGEWYTLDLDYPRIAGILRGAGFKGWVSLEMEGKEEPQAAVVKSYDLTMDKNADEVLEQALALPIGDRAALADSLIDSLETSADQDAGERWRAEIEKRISDLDSGRVQTVPWADVEARLRSRMG